jgi:hypothetical protein
MSRRIKPGALNILYDPDLPGGELETHSSTCRHCQRSTDFPSMKVMMHYVDVCRGCMKLICLQCVGKPCVPYEKRADMLETEHRLRSRIHLQAWRCY